MINYKSIIFEVEQVPFNTCFKLSDLFAPIKWKQVDIGTRRNLAMKFKIDVEENIILGVETSGKDSSGAQLYKKIEPK